MPKNTKNLSTADEIKRYVGILSEQHRSEVKLIGEQYQDIKKTLDSHSEMIGKIMVDVTDIKHELKTKVSYDDFAKLEKRVVRLEARA